MAPAVIKRSSLESWSGPTAAFKDFGARFLARDRPELGRGEAGGFLDEDVFSGADGLLQQLGMEVVRREDKNSIEGRIG